LEDQSSEHESFINRKRPAMEGLVQHLIGPAALLDQTLAGKPIIPNAEDELEPNIDKIKKPNQ
jgi:hypothetical protein